MSDFEFENKAVTLERAAALLDVFLNLCFNENPYTCGTISKDAVSIGMFADAVNDHMCVLEAASDIIKSVSEDLWKGAGYSDNPSDIDTPEKGAA